MTEHHPPSGQPRLLAALVITLAFVVIEALAGLLAHSLALLTDAGHNLTDVLALGLSWYAVKLSRRPAHAGRTFGYHRASILVALFNSTTLILMVAWIIYEAYRRFLSPPQVQEDILIGVGIAAFVVNIGTALLVRHGSRSDLSIRSTYLHLMGDAISTLGAVAAGLIIKLTGWQFLDPLVSVLIGLVILWNAWGIVRDTLDILLEGTPRDLDVEALLRDLRGIEGVRGVHDLHLWSITQGVRLLSAHILVGDMPVSRGAAILRAAGEMLARRYGITHTTLQLECENCEPDGLYCCLAPHHENEYARM